MNEKDMFWKKKAIFYLDILELAHSKDRSVRILSLVAHSSDSPMSIWTQLCPMQMYSVRLNLSADLPRKVTDIELDCMWAAETTNYL